MKIRTMRLNNTPYQMISSGSKTIEVRLFDEKRSTFSVGDEVEFTNRETEGEILRARIIALLRYETFEGLFSDFSPALFGGTSRQDLLEGVYRFYSKEDEAKYGVVGIKIKLI